MPRLPVIRLRLRARLRALPALVCVLVCAMPSAHAADDQAVLLARLTKLERQIDSTGLVELLRQLESLQEQVRALQGEIENQAHTIEQLRKVQRDTYADLDQRLATLAPGAAIGAAPLKPTVDAPLPTTAAPVGQSVAGTPAEQSMSLDIETNSSGPRLNDPGMALQRAALAADAQAAAARAAAGQVDPGAGIDPNLAPVPPGGDVFTMQPPTAPASGAVAPAPGTMMMTPAAPRVAPDPVPLPTPASGAGRAPTVDSPESEVAYREAFTLLKAGQYEQSIAAFNGYLQQYPASQYNDNAQYWLGEAYYVMGQYEPAIAQYQKVVTDYPDSQKQSHALLKIAYSYDELGQDQQAAKVLVELKQRYPGSAAARLADERLQRIGAANTAP